MAERSTTRAAATLETTPVDTAEAPLATETVPTVATKEPELAPTVVPPTETIEAATRIAPANLTLTAIRETVAAMAERSTARAAATLETTPVDTAEAPLATEISPAAATQTQEPAPTVVPPTATIEAATDIAPANLTLTVDPRNGRCDGGALDGARGGYFGNDARSIRPMLRLATATVPAAATETQEPSPTVVRPTATIGRRRSRYRASQSDFDGDPRNGGRPGGALDCASSDDFGSDACRYG